MEDKQKRIEEASHDAVIALRTLVPASHQEIQMAMRRLMDAKELEMFDLALFCEQETMRAQHAEAHFASCVTGAAMIEALLAFMCVRYEAEVVGTRQFASSTRKDPRHPYRDVIAGWSFEQFISVAEECAWIPSTIVGQEFRCVIPEIFRELVPLSHPELPKEEIEQRAQSLFEHPGTGMLRMTQMLRNSIHAGRWMRSKGSLVPETFTQWCRFATILCGEIRLCLLHLIARRNAEALAGQMEKLESILNQLPPEYRAIFEAEARSKLGLDAQP